MKTPPVGETVQPDLEIQTIDILTRSIISARESLLKSHIADVRLGPSAEDLDAWVRRFEQQKRHSSQKFTVMVLGEYNAGKSTFLNALFQLEKDRRLPSFDEPTNAIPIRLSFPQEGAPEAMWRFSDQSRQEITWKEAIDEAHMQRRVRRDLQEVQVFLDHPLLQYADFMDMPGTGTAYFKDHTEITREYIANAELVIWVIGHQEPSREGLTDFRLVVEHEVSIVTVFNAWGYLDPERDKAVFIDQEAIEEAVREDFPEAFTESEGFRVYSRKVLDAFDLRQELDGVWGLDSVRDYLVLKYLDDFPERADERRHRVRKEVRSIAKEAAVSIRRCRSAWDNELERGWAAGESIKIERNRVYAVEHSLRSKLRPLAAQATDFIFKQIREKAHDFITDHIKSSNWEFLKRSFSEAGRSELEKSLSETFRKKYLRLENNGWLSTEIGSYIDKCQPILLAEWRHLVNETFAISEHRQDQLKVPANLGFPMDRVPVAAFEAVKEVGLKMAGAGGILALLLFVPGTAILEVIGLLLYAGVTLLDDPFRKHANNTIRRFNNELDLQEEGFTLELINIVMNGPNAHLKDVYLKALEEKETKADSKLAFLNEGIDALEELLMVLDDASPRQP